MATYNETPQTGDMLQALSGLNYLVKGVEGDTSNLQGLSAGGLTPLIQKMGRFVDINHRPRATPDAEGNVTAADMNAQVPARDKLKDLVAKRAAGTLTDVESNALKSAMYAAGYEVEFASLDFSASELTSLESFNTSYLNTGNASLDGLRSTNLEIAQAEVERQAALEQAAIEQQTRDAAEVAERAALNQTLNSQFDSLMVYSGGLKVGDVGNDATRLHATRQMLLDNQNIVLADGGDIDSVMSSMFEKDADGSLTGQITQGGLERVLGLTENAMVPAALEDHLESGDPLQVSIAQNYLITQGYNNITADGTVRTDTVDAAEELLSREQTVPEGIYLSNGDVNYNLTTDMAATGQLLLPSDDQMRTYLGDEYETWEALNSEADRTPEDILSREEFAALSLLESGKYQEFLDNHNAAHVGLELDVARVQPVIDDPEVETNNPLGLAAQGEGYGQGLAFDEAGVVSNLAEARTTDGTAVFANTDQAGMGLIEYYKAVIPVDENGAQHITMYDALTGYHEATLTQAGDYQERMTAGDQWPTQSEAHFLEGLMHDGELDREFDLNNTADLNTVLTAVHAYRADKEGLLTNIDPTSQDYLTAYLNDSQFTDDRASTIRVAEAMGIGTIDDGIRVAEQPVPQEPVVDEEVEAAYAEQAAGQDPLAPTSIQTPETTAPAATTPTLPLPTPENMSYASVIPPLGIFERHAPAGSDITTQLSVPPTTSFNTVAPIINTGIPADIGADNDNPAGVDLGNVANRPNMSQANPDIFGNGQPRQNTVTSFPSLIP